VRQSSSSGAPSWDMNAELFVFFTSVRLSPASKYIQSCNDAHVHERPMRVDLPLCRHSHSEQHGSVVGYKSFGFLMPRLLHKIENMTLTLTFNLSKNSLGHANDRLDFGILRSDFLRFCRHSNPEQHGRAVGPPPLHHAHSL
jgi:hypothetical protein